MQETKKCKRCKTDKDSSEFYGLRRVCKTCAAADCAAYYAANKERIKAVANAYYSANIEKIKAKNAERYAANPERSKLRAGKWAKENVEKRRAYSLKWNAANRDKKNTHSKKWAEENREKVKETKFAYRAANRGAFCVYEQNRRARKLAAGGQLSVGLSEKLFNIQRGKCACCGLPLGNDYHMDHIMPLALGGSNTDDNIQLLRQQCNNQKRAKHPVEFMQQRGYLL
jgi:5-methylcytosine-specific restriction endonuclease McrA